jgi:spermidine synthase/MFS family permease
MLACLLSGAAGLMYEILWMRAFSLILGSTTQAAALTFAAFLTGLGLGARLFGTFAGRLQKPLRAYALVEIGIALTAVSTGLILHNQADVIGATLGAGTMHLLPLFLLALVLILPPTLLMGGTLPLILAAAQRVDPGPSIVGRFYGWNTLGAALGTLVCGFVTIRLFGVTYSYYGALILNLLAALICVLLVRHPVPTAKQKAQQYKEATDDDTRAGPAESYLLLIAIASGAVVLSLEVVWTRFAAFFLGNRSYAFATLMFAVLTLLALGAGWSARLYRTTSPGNLYSRFATLLVLSSLAVTLSAGAAWWLIEHQVEFEAQLPGGENLILLYRFLEAFILLAAPLLLLGTLFPLALTCSKHTAGDIGGASGRYYSVNAAGIIVGSLGTGFLGLELLGSFGMIKVLAGILLALCLYTMFVVWRSRPGVLVGLSIAGLVALYVLPGNYPSQLKPGESLLVALEDKHGLFRITQTSRNRLSVSNNRTELVYHLGAYSTDLVQQLQGHLGVHFNPGARRALVIGSGYGISAGALTLYDSVEHIDAVEILPYMVAAAEGFKPNNFSYHENAKVNVVVGDGRHFLLQQSEPYDIISLNVSDPHLPGGASLFHSEFYELAKQRLAPGGVVIQHVFGQERPIIASTLAATFPHTAFSRSYGNGYNAVASMTSLEAGMSRRVVLPKAALRQLRRSGSGRGFRQPVFYSFSELPAQMHSEIIASDDFPAVEYSWNNGADALFLNE